jgi:hypothetical protein
VRSGLAFTGVAVALIGVGVLLVAVSLSSGTSGSIVEGVSAPLILPNTNYTHVIPSSPQKSANVVFDWSATHPVQVALYVAGACANNTPNYVCPSGPALYMKSGTSGGWPYTGSVSEPYLLVVQNPNGVPAALNGTLVESYPASSTFGSGVNLIVLVAGSVVLIGIGSLALFLGLFLRGGVYGPKPEPVGQPDSAILDPDDLDDEGWETDPTPEHDIDEP